MNPNEVAYLEEAQAHYTTRLRRFEAERLLRELMAVVNNDGGQASDKAETLEQAVYNCIVLLNTERDELFELRGLRDMVNHDNGEEALKAIEPSQAAIEARLNLAHEREVADEIERELELLHKTQALTDKEDFKETPGVHWCDSIKDEIRMLDCPDCWEGNECPCMRGCKQ